MLNVSSLSHSLGPTEVLNGVDVDVPANSIVAITGPSGAGKTTLLRLIAGVDTPDTGRIAWCSSQVAGPERWVPPWQRPFAMVFQDLALWPHLRVRQHLDFVLKGRRGLPRAERQRIRDRRLGQLHIDDLANRYPSELSGGQQQRVAIARALVREPELLLLDEPFAHIDGSLAGMIWQAIREWREAAGATIVIVTHNAEEFASEVDMTFELRHGTLRPANAGHSNAGKGDCNA